MTTYASSQQAYRENAILTAPPERLVVMLYDGARRFLHQGAVALRNGDLSGMNNRLQRAEAIIRELQMTLDHEAGGEIAAKLDSIYDFCHRYLLEARLKRDPERIERTSELLGELREAWEAICVRAAAERAVA